MDTNTDQSDREPYAPETVLTELLGDHAKTRILGVFLAEPKPISVTDIAELGGMSRSTVYRNIYDLRDLNVIVEIEAGAEGRTRLYEINQESDAARRLAQLEYELLDDEILEDAGLI